MAGTSSVFGQSNLLFFFLILVLALGGEWLNVTWSLETLLFFFILLVIIMNGGLGWFLNEVK
ncbi:conserved hypothetical protein [Thermoanaerobacter mathranii subsp. mathranii str. A3]|uniref:Uncharacterized protein n=3 Tax=Thermoanaerobacter TaxID=1754 RepID=D3T7C8_THEIA|nr:MULTISPECIES: hypothetical protein [Thermoanaerobacter]ADD01860.1 conserved hypothetical protein [Thermoanaerobacter italicus Ab9]ADH60374.1 conserved hypothetical protein [Thermoanaerobacter mathranii subsp. mathranii str. A3]MDP9751300.1 hypothetical protein [Thermoanaerobacter pentosaceus]